MRKNFFILLLIYNLIFIPILFITFHLLGLFNKKVKRGINGRKNLFKDLEQKTKEKFNPEKPVFWFHCASLGEFEQAKPIILKLREKVNPNIIVTFFSPSGFEPSKNYQFANVISYIPFDSLSNAKKFINLIKTRENYLFLMKYDFWLNHLYFAHRNKFNLCLANAFINESKVSNLFKRFFYKTIYELFDFIFLISNEDKNSLEKLNPLLSKRAKVFITGDTRYDQVYLRSQDASKKAIVPESVIKSNDGTRRKIFVVGSSWEEDEKVIIPAIIKIQKYEPKLLTILVPHEPTEENIEKIEKELDNKLTSIRFSKIENYKDEKVVIVDGIGFLMTLYAYADVAYVGGSFKQGIHNVLEPATYGIPVIYGPKIQNSPEAQKLAQIGGGIVIKNEKQFYKALRKILSDENLRKEIGQKSFELVKSNLGATDKIIKAIGLSS
ncbi:3-deoxy-D-manno-octulosonic acid transferase [Candidatus Chrysopegis kryptomonas]|jgi:3-deoxy-D-manno-octulosonic-acid transferase|uniref:3-deoxy-D-manno-octulosonic acid transferase n=1 Tax=Candidatus Chryseopegocella kryptomonas TaxID=1633643 RepID=A0A0N7MVK9_9BACT|nr:glycosyltransferase N-terminal domain-containing protein [Candidatus Chrysopegis kryptomonas]CUS96131.1 3-deoxy-D-manno-octulosonic-acid transferase [Candidatus Chrysopegis kryptomonas]